MDDQFEFGYGFAGKRAMSDLLASSGLGKVGFTTVPRRRRRARPLRRWWSGW